jgi:hypothetical protein
VSRFRRAGAAIRAWTRQCAAVCLRVTLAIPGMAKWDWLVIRLARPACRAHPASEGLADLPRARLLELTRAQVGRAVMLGLTPRDTPLRDLLDQATGPELRVPVADAIGRSADVIARSQFLYEAICLSGPQISRDQRAAALLAAARTAATFLSTQARQILLQCLILGGQPLDPYQPPDLELLARRTATAILQEHPALDAVVHNRVTVGTWSTDVEILATALVGRPRGRAEAIADFFTHWKPDPALARRFAAAADVTRTATEAPRIVKIGHDRRRTTFRRIAASAVKWFGAPLVVAVTVLIAWRLRLSGAPLQPALGEALAALAVVAAIHVVSAQLAAARLDGVLARHSMSSIPIAVSYWSAVLMAATASASRHPRLDQALAWGSTVSTVLFIAGAVAAAWSLVRQTDPARAAALFADNRASFYRRSGKRQGRLQVRTSAFREGATRLGFISLTTEPIHVERRTPIAAARRGVHIPSLRRLRRIRSRPMWSHGHLRLQILAMVGTVVSAGTEIGAILPDAGSKVPHAERRRAAKAFRLHKAKRVEEAAEGAVVLTDVTARLARMGDHGGAERTGEALQDLLRIHLNAARRSRQARIPAGEPLPVTPALKDTVDALTAHLRDSTSTTELNVLSELLQRIVQLGDKSDAAVMLTAARLTVLDASVPAVTIASLLRVMARSCLQADDRSNLRQVQDEARKRYIQGNVTREEFIEVGAEIPALAAWINQPAALTAWRRFWDSTQPVATTQARIYGASRAGAANLAAGSITVAIDVVLSLRSEGLDLAKHADAVKNPDYLAREAFLSELGGGYLGGSPKEATCQFADFAQSIGASIGP